MTIKLEHGLTLVGGPGAARPIFEERVFPEVELRSIVDPAGASSRLGA